MTAVRTQVCAGGTGGRGREGRDSERESERMYPGAGARGRTEGATASVISVIEGKLRVAHALKSLRRLLSFLCHLVSAEQSKRLMCRLGRRQRSMSQSLASTERDWAVYAQKGQKKRRLA